MSQRGKLQQSSSSIQSLDHAAKDENVVHIESAIKAGDTVDKGIEAAQAAIIGGRLT